MISLRLVYCFAMVLSWSTLLALAPQTVCADDANASSGAAGRLVQAPADTGGGLAIAPTEC